LAFVGRLRHLELITLERIEKIKKTRCLCHSLEVYENIAFKNYTFKD